MKIEDYDYVILYRIRVLFILLFMEERKDEVKKYLTVAVNPVLKPIVEAIAKARPQNIMQFILEYAQKEICMLTINKNIRRHLRMSLLKFHSDHQKMN